jgi:DNA-binding GntR family transcriptional regulator
MNESYEKEDRLPYHKTNQLIYHSILEISKNEKLIRTFERLNSRLYQIRFLSNRRTDSRLIAVEEDDTVLKKLEERNGFEFNTLLREHFGHI